MRTRSSSWSRRRSRPCRACCHCWNRCVLLLFARFFFGVECSRACSSRTSCCLFASFLMVLIEKKVPSLQSHPLLHEQASCVLPSVVAVGMVAKVVVPAPQVRSFVVRLIHFGGTHSTLLRPCMPAGGQDAETAGHHRRGRRRRGARHAGALPEINNTCQKYDVPCPCHSCK